MNTDPIAVIDRDENIGILEPLRISAGSSHRPELTELALELTAKSAGFRRSLPEGVATALADLVRAANCYYSNLIEGHNTHPVDIERAMREDYSEEPRQRDLQLEARAHVRVQAWIDGGGLDDRAATRAGIEDIHRRFGSLVPDELLWVEDPESGERVRVGPGQLRMRDVKVGDHLAISAGALPGHLVRFEAVYGKLGRAETILSCAAAHHRLLWLHPFLDGNGRVARLMSYAMLREALDTGGIWSIARGLARQARRIVAALHAEGVLQSESTRSPLRIAFPATLAGRWMPGLFPEV